MVEICGLPSRRHWLLAGLNTAIAATVVAAVYPVLRFLWPRAATISGAQEVVAPFKVNEVRSSPENPFNFGGKPCLVVLSPEGARRLEQGRPLEPDDVRAFNAICTHVDCTVKYRPDKADIFCNCHDGVYDLNGKNIAGPPPRPLEAYRVTLRAKPGEKPGEEEIIVSRST